MKRVLKYHLMDGSLTLELPIKAEILKVHTQLDSICIWVLVDDKFSISTESRIFKVFGTGESIEEENLLFLDSVFVQDLVFHVFEVKG